MTRITQRSFSGGVISPETHSRTDNQFRASALKDAENMHASPEGPAVSRAGTRLAGGYDTGDGTDVQFLIPFEASEDDTYMLEFGDGAMRVLKNGAYVINSAVTAGSIVSTTAANPCRLEMDSGATAGTFSVGTLCQVSDPNGTSALHDAIIEITAIASEFITFRIVGGVTINNTGNVYGTIGSGATLSEVYEVAHPFAMADLVDIQYVQDVDTLIFAHLGYSQRALARTADDSWAFSTLTFEPSIAAPTGESATNTTGTGSTTYRYKVAAVDAETGEESEPSGTATTTNDLTTAGNKNTVSWTAVTGAAYYRVYRKYNGLFSFIGMTEDTSFVDQNIAPDTALNPQSARNPFNRANNKPAVAAFVDQRLTFAATVNNPQVVEMSTSVAPFNFSRALTPGASDAVSFRMRSQKLNRVHHIFEAERPLILTAGAEWFVDTTNDEPMKMGNFSLRPKTYHGSAKTPRPVPAGNQLLHVTRDGNTIRSINMEDVSERSSVNLTRLARHLFKNQTITSMDFALAPDNTLWVTLADGSLYSLLYMPDDGLVGWTPHVLGGTDVFVHQVAVVTEGAIDRPYFVVSRTIDGQTVTLVERLDDRAFTSVEDCYFVDCGLTYSGAATASLRGLLHLRGEAVSVLADGNVLDGVVVDDYGYVDLSRAAETIAVGLGYDAYIVQLPADFGDIEQLGSSVGRFVASSEVAVGVVDSRGFSVGLEGKVLNEVKQFTGVEPIPLATETFVIDIDGDWTRDQCIEVRQVYPLPLTVATIGPTWDIEDA